MSGKFVATRTKRNDIWMLRVWGSFWLENYHNNQATNKHVQPRLVLGNPSQVEKNDKWFIITEEESTQIERDSRWWWSSWRNVQKWKVIPNFRLQFAGEAQRFRCNLRRSAQECWTASYKFEGIWRQFQVGDLVGTFGASPSFVTDGEKLSVWLKKQLRKIQCKKPVNF